jgi:hypothetical protein
VGEPESTAVPARRARALEAKHLPPAEQARAVHERALLCATQANRLSVELARWLWIIHHVKIGDKYVYQYEGFEDAASYIAAPVEAGGLDLGARMVLRYLNVHETYGVALGLQTEEYAGIDLAKLELARPVLIEDGKPRLDRQGTEKWLAKAQALSRSDFRQEVADELDRPVRPRQSTAEPLVHPLLDGADLEAGGKLFIDHVRSCTCILTGFEHKQVRAAEPHHFPITRGAGVGEVAYMAIPLCRECHVYYQDRRSELMSAHYARIFQWMYRLHHALFWKLGAAGSSSSE